MGISDTKRELAANKMIYDVRRKPVLFNNFSKQLDQIMEDYGLTDEERKAFRNLDLKRLGELGVHPYFLPQVSRLFHGGTHNHNNSAAARAYGKIVIDGEGKLR